MSEHDPLSAVAGLADGTRRALYRHVAGAPRPVSREEAAAGVGIKRSLAAYHLDRLVDDGLLTVEFRRPSGRTGPGAGRPAKRYRRAESEVAVSLPPRSYRPAAEILLRAFLAEAVSIEALRTAAGEFGREFGTAGLDQALDALGFEARSEGSETVLCNCPFVGLRDLDLTTTCEMNLALVEGIVEAAGRAGEVDCILQPDDEYCCVRLRPSG